MTRPDWPDYPCIEWPGPVNSDGYGILNTTINGKKKHLRSHRVLYEAVFGPIPDELVIDHLCRNRRCNQPWHLELVTRGENVKRGISGEVQKARHAARTHCKNGHPLSGDNMRIRIDGKGVQFRECITCRRASQRESRARRKAAVG